MIQLVVFTGSRDLWKLDMQNLSRQSALKHTYIPSQEADKKIDLKTYAPNNSTEENLIKNVVGTAEREILIVRRIRGWK